MSLETLAWEFQPRSFSKETFAQAKLGNAISEKLAREVSHWSISLEPWLNSASLRTLVVIMRLKKVTLEVSAWEHWFKSF